MNLQAQTRLRGDPKPLVNSAERLRLLERILAHMTVPVTYVDDEGTVESRNRIAAQHPSKTPREVSLRKTNSRDV